METESTKGFFKGFEYEAVLKYVNKIARSLQGLLTDRSLEYDDLVGYGLVAATNAFHKWDTSHNGDRTDTPHLEAYIKTCIAGNMKNVFISAKRRNQLAEDMSVTDTDDEDEDDIQEDIPEAYNMAEDDHDDICGKSQRKFAKIFHAGDDESSIAMMDLASAKVAEDEDERIYALEDFIKTLSGIDLEIMNNMLSRSDDSIKDIATRHNVSAGYISRRSASIRDMAREFILAY